MSKQDYIPAGIQPFLVWHDQFKTALAANATTFGLLPADTTAVGADNTDYHTKVAAQVAAAAASKQATADLVASRAAAEKNVRALAKRIKAHPAYTEALGQALGLVGPEDTTDLAALRPEISGEDKRGGVVEISFNLAGSEGVNIYSRREGDAEFKFLARDTVPPYLDNRPMLVAGKPELRHYKAVYVVADQEVSHFSNEITVNCAPLV